MNDKPLHSMVALITGAGRAPAPEIARALAELGAGVALNDLSPTLLDPLVNTITGQGGQARSYVADATRGMPLRAMIDEVLSDWGRIDILVNNPRVMPSAALIEMDEWDWQRAVEMNLNGPFLVTQTAARLMREQGGGIILNIVDTNLSALEAPGRAVYAASQAGLLALTQAASREFIAYNIRVITLCPDEDTLSNRSGGEPQGNGEGERLSRFAAYLCTPQAAPLAGQVFRVSNAGISPEPGFPRSNESSTAVLPDPSRE